MASVVYTLAMMVESIYSDGSISIKRDDQINKGDKRVSEYFNLEDSFIDCFGYPGPWRMKRDGKIVEDW